MDVIAALRQCNAGRDPQRLALKYAKMKESPFVFLRGACPLFYATLPPLPAITAAPLAWCCGDLHFENFGSYKADNRLVYFDINDFDEAALAPCTWDIVRLLTSFLCGAAVLRATAAEATALARECLLAYRAALLRGKPLWVEAETACGLIRELLLGLEQRKRSAFLDKRTVLRKGHRQLLVDGSKALPASADEQAAIAGFMAQFAATQPNPDFFTVLDSARRIAGTGSLGLARFVILVEGKGSPDGNVLLDLKEARASALAGPLEQLGIAQPSWESEARRVVVAQQRLQAVDHAFLVPVAFDGRSWVLRGLQPSEDRVAIAAGGKHLDRLREVGSTMGAIVAWDQLRAAGRGGAAGADPLLAFAEDDRWVPTLLDIAAAMARTTALQWDAFRQAHL